MWPLPWWKAGKSSSEWREEETRAESKCLREGAEAEAKGRSDTEKVLETAFGIKHEDRVQFRKLNYINTEGTNS